MLKNPRDDEGRALCPICNEPIESRSTAEAGDFAYHMECWHPPGVTLTYRPIADSG
jgi:hypothetical protein